MEINDDLKRLMKELGQAINQSLSDSELVAEAMGNIQEAGYDAFLLLEATIGFHQRGEPGSDVPRADAPSGELLLSSQDTQFLKSLRIRLDSSPDRPANQG